MKTLFLFLSVSVTVLSVGGCKKQYPCDCEYMTTTTTTAFDKNGNPDPGSSFTQVPGATKEYTDKIAAENAAKSCSAKSGVTETTTSSYSAATDRTTVAKETTEKTCVLR